MIKIINRGKIDNQQTFEGIYKYDVFVNATYITSFQHARKDGLEMCLRKSADAIKEDLTKVILSAMDDLY